MYIYKPFPSLVEAVLERQRQEALGKQIQKVIGDASFQELPVNEDVPHVYYVKRRKRKLKSVSPAPYRCEACKRQIPYEMHLITCPTLPGNRHG